MMDALFLTPDQAGRLVPMDVLVLLERTFPEVRLMWHMARRRWWLVQTLRGGKRVPFRELGTDTRYEEPTYKNTVGHVARLAAVRSRFDRERWLAELDATAPTQRIEKQASESMEEGRREMSKRLFLNRIVVPKPWESN
jgi:hypothetical protein